MNVGYWHISAVRGIDGSSAVEGRAGVSEANQTAVEGQVASQNRPHLSDVLYSI